GVFTTSFSSTRAETKTVSARVGAVDISQQSAVLVTPAQTAMLAFTVQPSNTRVNRVITPAIEISASDQFANVTPSFNGTVTVALDHDASAFQDALLSGHHTGTAASGVARFNDLGLDRAGIGYTLRADAPGLARVVSHSFNETP